MLWLNSTLGLLLLLAHREETRGAWVQFKKPVLEAMPVLDLTRMSKTRLSNLARCYNDVAQAPLLPLPQMGSDPVRAKIDAAVCACLRLPPIDRIRELLGQEPLICLNMDGLHAA